MGILKSLLNAFKSIITMAIVIIASIGRLIQPLCKIAAVIISVLYLINNSMFTVNTYASVLAMLCVIEYTLYGLELLVLSYIEKRYKKIVKQIKLEKDDEDVDNS